MTMTKEQILLGIADKTIDVVVGGKLLAEVYSAAGSNGRLYAKVSEKGAISVYGLQRMPVTLYVEQWERLLAFGDEIRAFASAHRAELSVKGESPPPNVVLATAKRAAEKAAEDAKANPPAAPTVPAAPAPTATGVPQEVLMAMLQHPETRQQALSMMGFPPPAQPAPLAAFRKTGRK